MIDVIGVITECQGPTQIQIKSTGEFRDKMTITLSDDTNISIGATIWGEGCKDAKYVEGCIIAVKGARISDYGGKSLNIGDNCVIEFDPQNEKRYQAIQQWYE